MKGLEFIAVFPASHYVVPMDKILRAANAIEEELAERVEYFKSEDKLLEAQRIAERTNYDVEMLRETGFCSGVENYSRHLAGMPAGATPHTLMDYFGDDYLLIIDESHKTVPQVRQCTSETSRGRRRWSTMVFDCRPQRTTVR